MRSEQVNRSQTALALSPDEVSKALDRILASPMFASTERLKRFLEYAVTNALAGRVDRLKESILGIEVFDRGEGFDPRLDSIVRVEAGRLRAKLRQYYECEGQTEPVAIEVPTGKYVPSFRRRSVNGSWKLKLGVVAAVAMAAAGVLYVSPIHEIRRRGTSTTPSLAILPFINLDRSGESGYFAEGLAEELITTLNRIEGFGVIAHATTRHFGGNHTDTYVIGRRLGVQAVLTGSIRRVGDKLRVNAQLISTASRSYLWAEVYEQDMSQAFRLQEQIAQSVSTVLRIKLDRDTLDVLRRPYNAEVYNIYLRGRYYWNKFEPQAFLRAKQEFELAIEKDPGYAPAYAALAHCLGSLAAHGVLPRQEAHPQEKAAALKAVKLDDTSAEGHTALAQVLIAADFDWSGAEREYRRALQLNPGYAVAHHRLAMLYLAPMGRLEEAIAELRKAHELDPLSLWIWRDLGFALYYAHRYEEAIAQFQNALELDPRFHRIYWNLGMAYIQIRAFDKAVEAFQRFGDGAANRQVARLDLAYCYGRAGKEAEARKALRQELAKSNPWSYGVAIAHIGLGNVDAAFGALAKAADDHTAALYWLKVEPVFDKIRDDPRFSQLLGRLRLPQ